MPIQADVNPLPWDVLADAFEACQDAARALELAVDDVDRAIASANLLRAQAEYERAKEFMGALGNLILFHTLSGMGLPLQKKFAEVFDGLAQAAWDRATSAGKRATRALEEIDALKQRLRELELALANRTPGVGEPGLRVVG